MKRVLSIAAASVLITGTVVAQQPAQKPGMDMKGMVIAHPSLPADQADAGTRTARMAASGLRPSRRPVATMERRSA